VCEVAVGSATPAAPPDAALDANRWRPAAALATETGCRWLRRSLNGLRRTLVIQHQLFSHAADKIVATIFLPLTGPAGFF
jgi:hypothetical protein